jgi:hypothetical protein
MPRNNRELSQFASFAEIDDSVRKIGITTDIALSGGVGIGANLATYLDRIDNYADSSETLIVFKPSHFLDDVEIDGNVSIGGSGGVNISGAATLTDVSISGILTVSAGGSTFINSSSFFGTQYINSPNYPSRNSVYFFSNTFFSGIASFSSLIAPTFTKGLVVTGGIVTTFDRIEIKSSSDALGIIENPGVFGLGGTFYAMDIDGGLSVSANLQVGAGLSVLDYISIGYSASKSSEFLSTCSFKSDVQFGDTSDDEIRVNGRFLSSLIPDPSVPTSNLGADTSRWNFGYLQNLNVNTTSDISGNTTFNGRQSFLGQAPDITNGLNVTGVTTISNLFVSGDQRTDGNALFAGLVTFTSPSPINGVARTSIQANNVDIKLATLDAFYYFPLLNQSGIQTAVGGELFVNNGIFYNPISSTFYIGEDLIVNGNNIGADVSDPNISFTLLNSNVKDLNAFGDAESINIGNANPLGIATFNNYQFHVERLQIQQNHIQAGTGNTNITLEDNLNTRFYGNIEFNGNRIKSNSSTAYIFDETVQYANVLGDAIFIDVGNSGTGIVSIRNGQTHLYGDLLLKNNQILASDGAASIILDSNRVVTVFGDLKVGGSDILAGSGQTNITMLNDQFTIFAGDIRVNGNDIRSSDGNVNISMTSNTLTTIAGDLRIEGNDIQAGTGATNITLLDNQQTIFVGDIRVNGNSIRASNGLVNIEMEDNTKTIIQGDLQINGEDIRGADGTLCITIESPSGNVAIGSDLTANSVFFNGIDAVFNNENVKIKDNLIDVGLLEDPNNLGTLIGPNTTTNYDAGLLLNYYNVGLSTSKKAAIFWDNSAERIAIASSVRELVDNVLTVDSYAKLEANNLVINSQSGIRELFQDDGTYLQLKRVVIDAGTY